MKVVRPVVVLALVSLPVSAQKVTGVVVLDGKAPAAGRLAVTKDQKVCGADVPDDSLMVSPEGGVANAVVVVKVDAPAQPPPRNVSVDQKECRFVPRVNATTVGSTIELLNSDAVLHNARGMRGSEVAFNFAFPLKNLKRQVKADKPGVIELHCDAGHTWMRAYVHVLPHALFAVTDEKGRFSIDGVPPEATALEVRHERLPEPIVVPLRKNGPVRVAIKPR